MARAALIILAAAIGLTLPMPARGQEAEPGDPALGLLTAYSAGPDSPAITQRIEPDVRHDWGDARPDPRVPRGAFSARWIGSILIQQAGPHRFSARTDGRVAITIDGRPALRPGRVGDKSEPIDLPAGLLPFSIEYRHERGPARIAIDWEGPGFAPEPLPARVLYHDPAGIGRLDPFEEGRRLADRLGCANCHRILDLPAHRDLGPPLADAGRAIEGHWLAAWLVDPTKVRARTRMPALGDHGLSPAEASDIAAFLAEISSRSAPKAPVGEMAMALNVADPGSGRRLFRSAGCLGCHTREADAIGGPGDFRVAPDLSDLGRKRTSAWVATYLAPDKSSTSAGHRPRLGLRPDAAAHLASYLAAPPSDVVKEAEPGKGDVGRGRRLVESLRCAACHDIPGLAPPEPAPPLHEGSRADAGCLSVGGRRPGTPRFALSEQERAALLAFVSGLPEEAAPTPAWTLAEDSMRRLSCMGCHTRDGRGGAPLGPQLTAYLAADAELAGLKGTLTPPDLTAVGDKLRPEFLALAIRGSAPVSRPWLAVRMPASPFAKGEAEAIAAYLQQHDGAGSGKPADGPVGHVAADRPELLVGQQGFGCLSCHVLAGRIPPGGEPETLGPDLALAHRRMSHGYFRRWIADPQRILPGTPMPQFLQPVATRPGTLDDQLDAIWGLLGSERLSEVAASGTREVRRPGKGRAEVVRDVVVLPDRPVDRGHFPRGLAIGLENGQSLLFDADRLAWVSWWHGGFLTRTKSGRLWEWHPDGLPLWTAHDLSPTVVLTPEEGRPQPPRIVRDRFGRFSELRFEGRGVILAYDLNGPRGGVLRVVERIQPAGSGWSRDVTVSGVPDGERPSLPVSVAGADAIGDRLLRWKADGRTFSLGLPPPRDPDHPELRVMEPAGPGVFRARVELGVEAGSPAERRP
jgi:mono/diheme cytochrome c family protein